MKKIFSTILVFLAMLSTALLLVACNDDYSKAEITAGKYYAENSADSYVEILPGQKVRFVNVDFSDTEEGIEDVLPGYFEGYSIAERFGNETHKYIPMTDADKNIHFYVDIPDSAFAIRIHNDKENRIALSYGGIEYILQAE